MADFVPGSLPHEIFHRTSAAPAEMTTRPQPPPERESSDFEWIGDLGEGFFARVYKVRNRRTGNVFAIKKAFVASRYAGEEVEVLRRVAGSPTPFVVHCHAVFIGNNGVLASVLEFMDAGSLLSVLCRRGRRGFPEPALAEVAMRCLMGLNQLHSRGVAHLDVKPDNFLANSLGEVKITDFNTSCVIFGRTGGKGVVPVPTVTGTTAFLRLEPELICDPYDAMAADVWGFGHTILELFLGRVPDSDRSSPPSVPENVEASAELREFLDACLQEVPAQCATVSQLLKHPFIRHRDAVVSSRALRELIKETLL